MASLPRRTGRGRRMLRIAAWGVAAVTVAFWPFAARYTSFGVDTEHAEGARIRCDWWRVRWPGDGRVGLLHEVTWRPHDGRPVVSFDLGGAFLRDDVPHWLLVLAATGFAGGLSFWTGSVSSAPRR